MKKTPSTTTFRVCAGPDWKVGSGICGVCGVPITNKWFCRASPLDDDSCAEIWRRHHWWSSARAAAKKRDRYRCVRCGGKERLEVHHIIPLEDGSHSRSSHRHHLENLETLCHRHHLIAGREQRNTS